MARISTPAIWLPGYLNTCNSPTSTGAGADAAGNPYFQGLNPGKMIVLGADEAQNVAAPNTTLYDGSYQWVHLDSSATAAYATEGYAAYVRLDSGATVGALPETDYDGFIVTTGDQVATVGAVSLQAGVFVNPATINGVANGPTPGNWTMIFVGAGRAQVQYAAAVTATTVGIPVSPKSASNGAFDATTTAPTSGVPYGLGVTAPANAAMGVAYYRDIIFHFAN